MNERILKHLQKDRPMTSISMRVPEDVIEDLKAVAPLLGFSGYQPLIRAYIGQGLRKDLERLENSPLRRVADSLRLLGVDPQIIDEALRRSQGLDAPYERPASASIEHACEPGETCGS